MVKECKHLNITSRPKHDDSCCSCHINPPCSYCTDLIEYCTDCGEEIEQECNITNSYNKDHTRFFDRKFTPVKCGNGFITGYQCDGRSGSTMVFEGTYIGDVTNTNLLEYFGTGTFGHRFGYCGGGNFKFTKITD